MALALRLAAKSHVGLVRDGNEDSGYAGHRLLVVADGMGGHVAGEVASSVAVTTLSALDDPPGPDSGVVNGEAPAIARAAAQGDLLTSLRDAVEAANEQLRLLVGGDPALRGMGTTLTALLHVDGKLGLAHVGDSRCYLLRNGTLSQVTTDHTFVQTLVDEGRITAEDAETHPQRSLLTRALDGREDVEPDVSLREAKLGDRYLLCSDGLSGVVREPTLQDTLLDIADPDEACEALIDLALRAGGPDNITCIVADIVDDSAAAVPAAVSVGSAARSPDEQKPAAPAPPRRRPQPQAGRSSPVTDVRGSRDGSSSPRRTGLRFALVGVVLLALLGAAAYGLYAFTQQQYYVATAEGNVAIYRGVEGSFLGIPLSAVDRRADIPLASMPEIDRVKVTEGLPANDLPDAERIVANLRERAAECDTTPAAPTPTPASTRKPAATSSTAAATPAEPAPEPPEPGPRPCREVPR